MQEEEYSDTLPHCSVLTTVNPGTYIADRREGRRLDGKTSNGHRRPIDDGDGRWELGAGSSEFPYTQDSKQYRQRRDSYRLPHGRLESGTKT